MKKLYVISGVTGMTGNELVRQILVDRSEDLVIGFDNFYALQMLLFVACEFAIRTNKGLQILPNKRWGYDL